MLQTTKSKIEQANIEKERLISAIASLKNTEDFSCFLSDLCTPQELAVMSQRWQVAKLLHKGLTSRVICSQTGASTTTISRVNRSMNYGSGYKKLLQQRHPHHHKNKTQTQP